MGRPWQTWLYSWTLQGREGGDAVRWRDDGTMPLWQCPACGGRSADVIGLRPRYFFHVRFTYEHRGWHFGYTFEGGYVDDIAQIKEPRCIECHAAASFVWFRCPGHEPYSYLSSEGIDGTRHAISRCRVCAATLNRVEVTRDDLQQFAHALLHQEWSEGKGKHARED